MGWNARQKKDFAKEVISLDFHNGQACGYLTGKMRVAIIQAFCFNVVRGQAAESVDVAAMDDLLAGVRAAVEANFGPRFFE